MSLTLRFFKERPELVVATRLAAQIKWDGETGPITADQ